MYPFSYGLQLLFKRVISEVLLSGIQTLDYWILYKQTCLPAGNTLYDLPYIRNNADKNKQTVYYHLKQPVRLHVLLLNNIKTCHH